MRITTVAGKTVDEALLCKYTDSLVNHFFKILPMRENGEASLPTYLKSLQVELFGFGELIKPVSVDPSYMTLLSVLQYLINHPTCEVADVKREVFRAIRICHKLRDSFRTEVAV